MNGGDDRSCHWIRSNEALVVTRYGKDVLGIYYPLKSPEIPREAGRADDERMAKHLPLWFWRILFFCGGRALHGP